MDFVSLLSNAFSSGAGAFVGGLAAYYFAVRKDKQRQTADYLSLLLLIYGDLDAIHDILVDIPEDKIKEVEGEKIVILDLPFPFLNLTPLQFQTFLDVAPDKQMSLGLLTMQHFLTVHAQRIKTDGVNILPLALLQNMEHQLKGMLLSVRIQYEQESNSEFPFYELTQNTSSQTKL